MKNKWLLNLCLITCISAFSCSEDIKFTLPEIEPLLSVQSFVDPDNDFGLMVTMARPLQEPNIQLDRNCQVDIYENGLFFTRLNLDSSEFNRSTDKQRFLKFLADPSVLFSESKEYKIEVKYPEFEIVTAKSIKPEAVKIKEITHRYFVGEMPDWYYETPSKSSSDAKRDTSLIEFTIKFDDPSKTSNFYRVGVNLITRPRPLPFDYFERRLQYASLTSADPCFMKFTYLTEHPLYSGWTNPTTYELLFNDKISNGKEQTLKILIPGSAVISPGTKYLITLYTINEDYYKYMVDRWKFIKTENDPFAEPIKMYSNLSNGCGIFAFSSVDIDTLQL